MFTLILMEEIKKLFEKMKILFEKGGSDKRGRVLVGVFFRKKYERIKILTQWKEKIK